MGSKSAVHNFLIWWEDRDDIFHSVRQTELVEVSTTVERLYAKTQIVSGVIGNHYRAKKTDVLCHRVELSPSGPTLGNQLIRTRRRSRKVPVDLRSELTRSRTERETELHTRVVIHQPEERSDR